MSRKLLVALALAQASQAFLEDYVEVVKTVEVIHIPPSNLNIAADVIGAQQQNNPGVTACAAADAVVTACYNRGVLETTAAVAAQAECLCCFSSTALYPIYSACASYIFNSVPGASTVYSAVSELWDACSGFGTGLCSRGTPVTPTLIGGGTIATTTTRRAPSTTAPLACTSLAVVLASCSSKLGPALSTARDDVVASCLCADRSGNANTAVEEYASGCAPWVRTAVTTDYPLVSILQTVCAANPLDSTSASGGGIVFTPIVATGTNGLGGVVLTPTAGASQSSSTGGTNAAATSQGGGGGDGNSASGVVAPAVMIWAGTLVFSFIYFI